MKDCHIPDAFEIINHFYPSDTPLRRRLIEHSIQVRDKALAILEHSGIKMNSKLVAEGAMLHDIGIMECDAPDIFCNGTQKYIAHGIIGGQMLRKYAAGHNLDLEPYARICERHTGSGLTANDIRKNLLPIPERITSPKPTRKNLSFRR